MSTNFQVPTEVSFQKALSLTQRLFSDVEQFTPATLESHIASLVGSNKGARGFFATYLTNDFSLLPEMAQKAILQGLRTSPDIVAELLVKNLVMSTAMTLTHSRQGNSEMAQQSQQTRERTARVINQVKLSTVEREAQQLWQSLTTGTGSYTAFLERWEYDNEQKQAMQKSLRTVFPGELW